MAATFAIAPRDEAIFHDKLPGMNSLEQAIKNARARLLAEATEQGHWHGELSSSALSTATAVVALSLVGDEVDQSFIRSGIQWLLKYQNTDGGWGDTTISKSNLSTTLLVWSAMGLAKFRSSDSTEAEQRCEAWILREAGSLEPEKISRAVIARYGKDKTFSVPILMMAAIGGRLGSPAEAWRRVLPLPFELAALPRTWFGAIGLPVVSYALPALIAIGHARFHQAPPSRVSPLYWIRKWAWRRVRLMLRTLQPSTGGYLEATPLTSFVTMALGSAGEKQHPCVAHAAEFLRNSMRADGSWPIDTNLATWGTTLSIKALGDDLEPDRRQSLKAWLLGQQYQAVHPFTNAAPGGWAWTDLPGGVPDADDTAGALIALWRLCGDEEERHSLAAKASAGVQWLLDLQNRDGGIPTFCRGWGALPFDRSTPELTAHALWAWHLWREHLPSALKARVGIATSKALLYLSRTQIKGAWEPLWFGSEHSPREMNLVYGTAQVCRGLVGAGVEAENSMLEEAVRWLAGQQQTGGGWGGSLDAPMTLEETGVTLQALAAYRALARAPFLDVVLERGVAWLLHATDQGTQFPSAPIGLYFARLWYHERLYPIIWTLGALQACRSLVRKDSLDSESLV